MAKKIIVLSLALCVLLLMTACEKEEVSFSISSDISQTETNEITDKQENTSKSKETSKPTNTPTTPIPNVTQPKNINVEQIFLEKASISIITEEAYLLGATVYPFNATDQTLYWESSNPAIASVDSNGNVKGLSQGSVSIIARSSNGVHSTQCLVIVKNNIFLQYLDYPFHLYSYDGKEYLGKLVTNKYDTDSIWNEYGTYGSKFQTNSIWNEFGKYGSKFQSTSAFNQFAIYPPIIVTNSGNKIGYLTSNEVMPNGYTIVQLERALKKANQ